LRAIVQRVSEASVGVKENESLKEINKIGKGLVVFIGVGKEDKEEDAEYLAEKISHLRIFPDENDRMNLSILDVKGEILAISQFTLYGDCRKGRRPDFTQSAQPESAEILYKKFLDRLKNKAPHLEVRSGVFGAIMKIEILNDGPVTIMLDSKVTK